MSVRIQMEPFDPGAESNAFLIPEAAAGAMVTFTGLVRSHPADPINELTLECYPELAMRQIERIAQQAVARFALIRIAAIHRYGTLLPGEPIVQVMALARHRRSAFEGAEFLMDFLKTDAPFWKKETTPSGSRWVEAQATDNAAKARWL